MKTIFLWLLSKYTDNEKNRIEVLKIMYKNVQNNYSEQTTYGNVYNYFIEFVMSNTFIIDSVLNKDKTRLEILKNGLDKAFDRACNFIENEIKN